MNGSSMISRRRGNKQRRRDEGLTVLPSVHNPHILVSHAPQQRRTRRKKLTITYCSPQNLSLCSWRGVMCIICLCLSLLVIFYGHKRGLLNSKHKRQFHRADSIMEDDDLSVLDSDFYDELFVAFAQVSDGKRTTQDVAMEYYPSSSSQEHLYSLLGPMYAEPIMEQQCNLTVVLLDPRLPDMAPGSPIWFTLESVATFASFACVSLQTSSCVIRDQLIKDENMPLDVSENLAQFKVSELIYLKALPRFRQMIERGQVRVTFPDHKKYNLKSCSNFDNPSWAFMNVNYWADEFVHNVDSDFVLVIQDDAVLCQHLDMTRWNQYAYVGSVWPKKSNVLMPHPLEGMCRGMPARWKSWLVPQMRWEKQQEQMKHGVDVSKEKFRPRPAKLLDPTFPPICRDGIAPIGNGGLSLRSRKWLLEVIHTCPHFRYSGIDTTAQPLACKVIDTINEDFYFGTILPALGAPLPNALDAAHFSVEMLWPEDVSLLYYHDKNNGDDDNGFEEQRKQRYEARDPVTIPIGFHKPWWYNSNELLLGTDVSSQCKLLKYIFKPEDSRWREFIQEADWAGVGK
mmetsp:Transcript_2051/g.3703  ORF Transcript_2051/g.3703 Transcript_2051/m.3703 type:complete len:569 (-) Transcript_2051:1898-3604(-)